MRATATAVLVLAVLFAAWMWIRSPDDGSRPPSAADRPAGTQHDPTDSPHTPARLQGSPERGRSPGREAEDARARDAARHVAGRKGTHQVAGRVVDDRRHPVAGATVRLYLPLVPPVSVLSGVDGCFRIEAAPTAGEGYVSGAVHVVDLRGRTALAPVALGPCSLGPVDVGTIEVSASSSLDVRVVDNGKAIEGARLIASSIVGLAQIGVGTATTDRDGRAHLTELPRGIVHLRATGPGGRRARFETVVPLEDPTPIEIVLAAQRHLDVRVLEEDTGTPIAGAKIQARVVLRADERLLAVVPYSPPLEPAPTGADGRTIVHGICEGDALRIWAKSDAYPAWGGARAEPATTSVVIRLIPPRTVSWLVEPGERPVPPDGTEIRLRPWGATHWLPSVSVARMCASRLVVEGLSTGEVHLLAVAPDGSLAELHARDEASEGVETSFRRPRRIEVHVTEEGRRGIPGVGVEARGGDGRSWGKVVRTGADGVAILDDLPARPLQVNACVTATDDWGVVAGETDLTAGDGRVDLSLGTFRDLEVHVGIGGEARLPSGIRWSAGDAVFAQAREDPEAGILHVHARPRDPTRLQAFSLEAPGFQPVRVGFTWGPVGTPTVIEVELEHAGVLVVRIAARPDARFYVEVQRATADGTGWKTAFDAALPSYDTPGEHRWDDVHPGTYRVRDLRSGLVSDAVTVYPSREPSEVSLDLTGTYTVSGRVEVPEDYEARTAQVVCEGAGIDTTTGYGPGKGVRKDGSFEIVVPGGRAVTLRAWHRTLKPANEGGSIIVTGPRDDLVLRLIEGPSAVFRVLPPSDAAGAIGERGWVSLYEREIEGEPVANCALRVADGGVKFAGFAPGVYTLWIDLPPFAPRTIHAISLGPGQTDLGTIALEQGSVVRVRLLVKDGKVTPGVHGWADCEAEPGYDRDLSGTGTDLAIRGLGPGTFEAWFSWEGPDGEDRTIERTLEVDGRAEYEIELDLR